VECPECGSENKRGNKFCFECGFRLPSKKKAKAPIPAAEAKRIKLKKKWLSGSITSEEYRAKLLRLKLKERFDHGEEGPVEED
jgi:hypothetical protein